MILRDLSTHLQTLCHEGHSTDVIVARLGEVEIPITAIKVEPLKNGNNLIVMEVEE